MRNNESHPKRITKVNYRAQTDTTHRERSRGMNQYMRIARYINDFGSITARDAFADLGISKLSTRIGEMERKGIIKVERVTEKSNNRYGEPCSYTRYYKVREA